MLFSFDVKYKDEKFHLATIEANCEQEAWDTFVDEYVVIGKDSLDDIECSCCGHR